MSAAVSGIQTSASFSLTNTAGPAAIITATAGTPQTAAVNAAFATALQATVKDAYGNPVSGVTITFTAPSSGASGTFANGTATTTATTDTSGRATASAFTANTTAGGPYTVGASASGVQTAASFSLTNTAGAVAAVTATVGSGQSALVGTGFATALQATVTDGYGNPVSGVTVTFTAPSSGASGTFANGTATTTATTDASGRATASAFTANGTGGAFTVNASTGGVVTSPGFSLTNTAPVISISPGSVAFGNQMLGTSSAPTPVTISNTGTGSLVISALALSGSNQADFPFTCGAPLLLSGSSCAGTIAPNNSATVNVTFKPLNIASRSATLTITDNASGSPHQVNLTGTGTTPIIVINPTSQSLPFGNQPANTTSAPLTVTISNSSGANSNLVISGLQITGTNAAEFAFACGAPLSGLTCTGSLAPGNSATVSVTFTPAAAGTRSASLMISDNDNISLGVSPQAVALSGIGIAPGIAFSPTSLTFGTQQLVGTKSSPANISISNPGTAGLVIYGVSITGTNASEFVANGGQPFTATVAPTSSTPLAITFSPINTGTRSATLTIFDNINGGTQQNPHSDTVPLSGTGYVLGVLTMPSLSVGTNLEVEATVGLSNPAISNLTITITSSDPTKILLSTDPTQQGSNSVTLTVLQGWTMAYPGVYVQSLENVPAGSTDTVPLTVSAPGYATIQCTVTLTPSALALTGPNGYGQNFSTTATGSMSLTVSAFQLDSNSNLAPVNSQGQLVAQLVRGSLNLSVSVSSADTTVGTITGSPAALAGGSSSTSGLAFQPVAAGSTQLSVAQPSGFSSPASGAQLTATVGSRQVLVNPTAVGYQLQTLGTGQLSDPAPAGGLAVTINTTPGTPGSVLLSANPGTSGSSQVILTVPAGTTALPAFYVQGETVGSSQLQASAAGYNFSTGNNNGAVTVTPSGFVLAGSSGVAGQAFSTTLLSGDSLLTVTAKRLDPSGNPVQTGTIAGGVTNLQVGVVSGTSSVGAVIGSPAIFNGGDSTNENQLLFQPNAQGATTLTVVQPTGFSSPTSGGSLTATVGPPTITLGMAAGTTIGANLQLPASGSLNVSAPSTLNITITSSNPNAVLLATSATAAGQQSITVSIPAYSGLNGAGFPTFYVQGLQSSGGATLTASASGWVSGTIQVAVGPSGFVLNSPNGVGADFGTTIGSPNTTLNVMPYLLDPNNNDAPLRNQALAGGLTETVYVTSGNTAVGTILGSPVSIGGGSSSGNISFQPVGVGVTTLTLTEPSGFSSPSSGATLNADVPQ